MDSASRSQPAVSIVIPAFNKWEFTSRCLQRLAENTADVDHEVIVVDNGSSDGTAAGVQAWPKVRYQRNDENLGFAKATNQGARLARGRYLMLLNNDTEPQRGWLSTMVKIADNHPAVAIVGCKLLFPNGTIQHGGVVFAYAFPEPITPFHLDYRKPANARNDTLELRAVTAACMLVRTEVYASAGGLDEAFVNGYEDVDFCLKVWSAGGKIIYTPDAVVVHHESVSDGRFKNVVHNVDRLNDRWMERFSAFDMDCRRTAKPAAVDPARPGASVIVICEQALSTIAPCLENIAFTIGGQDELILVDNGSTGASRRFPELFASRHPSKVSLVRCAERQSLSTAVRNGLERASRPYVAVVDQNVKVVTGWLDRLIGHLGANRSLGGVTASRQSSTALSDVELFGPLDPPDVARWQPPAAVPGQVAPAVTAQSGIVVAEADVLRRALADRAAQPFGRDPGAFSAALAAHDRRFGRAPDVVAYRFNETQGVNDQTASERIADGQSAALRSRTEPTVPVTTTVQDFPTVVSRALRIGTDDLLAVVCDGVVTTPDWLPLLAGHLHADARIAAIGPATNAGAGNQQSLGNPDYADLPELPDFAARWTRLHRGEHSFATRLLPNCLLMRRRCLDEVGGLDSSLASAAGAMEDLCIRLTMAGHRLAVAHDVFVHTPAAARSVIARADAERLQQFYATFNTKAPRWVNDVTKPHRLLLIPRWDTPAWRRTVTSYLRAFGAADPVALLVRVESPTAERIDKAFRDVSALMTELHVAPDHSADIVFEATQVPDAQRGGLYTSATRYLRDADDDQPALVREAVACGLRVLAAGEPAELRRAVLG